MGLVIIHAGLRNSAEVCVMGSNLWWKKNEAGGVRVKAA